MSRRLRACKKRSGSGRKLYRSATGRCTSAKLISKKCTRKGRGRRGKVVCRKYRAIGLALARAMVAQNRHVGSRRRRRSSSRRRRSSSRRSRRS